MINQPKTPRIDKTLFEDDGHFLGRPADFDDRIVQRRLRLVHQIEGFTGKDLSIVDVGCGNGASLFQLAPFFKSGIGVDVYESHGKTFNAYKEHLGVENVSFKLIDLDNDPIPESFVFDRLISFEVIEHLRSDDSAKALFNLLKPGGIAAVSVPNKWWLFETHGAKLPLLPWNRVPFFSWLPKTLHERFANARIYTPKRIRETMQNAGFEVLSVENITAPMDVVPEGPIRDFLVNNMFNTDTTHVPSMATALFVVAKRPL